MQDVVKVDGVRGRVIATVVAVLAVALACFGARWQIGDMVARLTSPADENAIQLAKGAVELAPSDPYASALRAEVLDPDSPDTKTAVEMAEQTVRLSPYDHRWHVALARALANDGRVDRADAEFKRAIELAPTYADGRWYYGNFLLRQGRRDDAVAQFRVATVGNPQYRTQVLSLMWDYAGHDAGILESVIGDDPDSVAELARFLAAHGLGSDALRDWSRLTEGQKAAHSDVALMMVQGLLGMHKYADTLEFSRQLGGDPGARFEAVSNGSFETPLEPSQDAHFNWRITRNDPKLDIAVDDRVRRDGSRSLRLTFKGTARPDLFNAAQSVAVMPGAKYRLTFWIRTENLKAPAGPLIEVSTADESKILAHTDPFSNGTNEWRQVSLDIAVPGDTDGVEIRTRRAPCGGDDCPISGIVWYDDFVLTRR